MNLSSADRSMLAKVLGMLGSTHDGEVVNAARKAHQLLQERGTTWPDLLLNAPSPLPIPESDHVVLARDLLGRGKGICTDWEMRFLRGVLAFKTLSAHQQQTLDGIREKVDAANIGA